MKTHIKKLCDEWYNKGRADAIEEMIYFFENKAICVNAECIHIEDEYSCVRCIAEQLKEQKDG